MICYFPHQHFKCTNFIEYSYSSSLPEELMKPNMGDFRAIARLIRTKLESKHFDVYEVKEWLGHTQIQTTMSYVKDAKHYYKLAPFDWIHRALRITKKSDEDCSRKSKNPKIEVLYPKSLREKDTGLRGFEPLADRLRADCST